MRVRARDVSEATTRREATRADWLAAAGKLAAAVMEARTEVVEGNDELPALRGEIAAAIREWDHFAWNTNPYLPESPAPLDPPDAGGVT
jgi:hypothetical protein